VSKKRPVVVRAFAPDEEAKLAALKLLIEQSGTLASHATVVRAGYSNSEERRLQASSRGPKDQYEPLRD